MEKLLAWITTVLLILAVVILFMRIFEREVGNGRTNQEIPAGASYQRSNPPTPEESGETSSPS
ncbi:hypothetical protein QIK31_gp2 [ssRNA phage SRR6253161_1]|uniref:Uncharacterized protein n=1 Tax=ssRNA phage SRR6253161_1 TaxID=2786488 RepID=A0A8S5L0H1_9VIRU|nr:hypothetical protein QIK31_gp2 [ssRNA phage SRR6253161_1]DAD50935.1 TPA_asm: hypothetical protein [ssRNA phage SRR6253161_1]